MIDTVRTDKGYSLVTRQGEILVSCEKSNTDNCIVDVTLIADYIPSNTMMDISFMLRELYPPPVYFGLRRNT